MWSKTWHEVVQHMSSDVDQALQDVVRVLQLSCHGLARALQQFSNTRVCADVAANKVIAAASAEELAMLPADSKSLPSYLSTPALLQCFHAMSGSGLFEAANEVPAAAATLMQSAEVVEHALLAAEAQLVCAAAARRSHGDVLAAWAVQPDVQRACEHMLGLPDWRELLQPVLHGSLVRLPAARARCSGMCSLLMEAALRCA